MGYANGYYKALSFLIKVIHFPNGIVILRTKRIVRVEFICRQEVSCLGGNSQPLLNICCGINIKEFSVELPFVTLHVFDTVMY
jgi:hypothetical protein